MRTAAILLTSLALASCSSSAGSSGASSLLPQARTAPLRSSSCGSTLSPSCSPIKHVVIVIQENRSFENLFAGFPHADAPMTGTMHDGTVVRLHPISLNTTDIDHGYGASIQDYDGGKMDGFDLNWAGNGQQAGKLAYSYVIRTQTAPYWSMARQYTLADKMFPTQHGPSWTAHIDLIAATTNLSPTQALVDFPSNSPWDCAAPAGTVSATIDKNYDWEYNGPAPCFTQFRTMADSLDAAGVSWQYYAPKIQGDIGGIWSPFGAIQNVRYGPDWKKVVTNPATILSEVQNGHLAQVTWVTPEWNYSDHPGGDELLGPSWVSAIVNTIGQSKFWKSTAIVVLWDDWGGFYDDAVPPQLDFKGLGLRVPCLIVSPYARHGYVSHTQYEFGSVLRFVEDNFGVPPLGTAEQGYSDARATSIVDSFDFTQTPPAFKPIVAPYPPTTFARIRESGKAPDDE